MRTVVSNPYHLWVHQSQFYARNASGNRSFSGANAYSYSTVVARIATNKKGQRAYLLTTRNYSVTTNRQMREIASAIPDGATVFRVDNVQDVEKAQVENCRSMAHEIARLTRQASRCRLQTNKVWMTELAESALQSLRDYVQFFSIKGFKVPDSAELDKLSDAISASERLAARREREAKAKSRKEQEERIQRWIDGDPYVNRLWLDEAYLRVKGEEVQTSQGAVVPLHHVLRAMPFVLAVIETGRTYCFNPDHPVRLGPFTLSSISKSGDVRAGCHLFEKSEVLRFAGVLKTLHPFA